jgi:hypothetical protein
MTDLPEVDATDSPDLAETFRQIAAKDGFVSNLLHVLAHAPGGLLPFADLDRYCRLGTHLSAKQRALAMLVCMRDVHYGWMHKAPLARAAGLTAEQLILIREGRTPRDLEPAERALCDYAFEINACRRAPPRVQEAMSREFEPRQIVDAALLTAFNMGVAALVLGLEVELEPPAFLQQELERDLQAPG